MSGTFNTTSAFSPVETYSTRADIENAFIRDDVLAWADGNNNGDVDEIAARIQWSRIEAQIRIHEVLRAAKLTIPATAENFSFYTSLASIEAVLAAVLLYQSRGIRDQQQAAGDVDGVMQGHYDRAMARLKDIVDGELGVDDDDATAQAGTFQFIRISRGRTCGDEYSGCN